LKRQLGKAVKHCAVRARQRKQWGNPMQDLFQTYVSDLNKLKDAFHNETHGHSGRAVKGNGQLRSSR
jgi:hypothetical protein